MSLHIDFLTLFPEMFGYLDTSILKRARSAGVVSFGVHDMRVQATNRHRTVDDRPFGGGVGMVLKPDIVKKALDALALPEGARVLVTTPQGRVFDQPFAKELAKEKHLVFLCGHYEAFDERVHDTMVTDEVSIGDYVLTGGELPALVMTDAIVRLRPGAVGKEASAHEDSFYHGLLDYPHYTRPAEFEDQDVPPVLMGGHHAEVETWRRQEALKRTYLRRPDLLAIADLTNRDRAYLARLEREMAEKGRA
jgi:tRNA (guanine37-N1)-methyltransferase